MVSGINVGGQVCYLLKLKVNVPDLGPEINGTQEVSNLMGKMHDPEVCYHLTIVYLFLVATECPL